MAFSYVSYLKMSQVSMIELSFQSLSLDQLIASIFHFYEVRISSRIKKSCFFRHSKCDLQWQIAENKTNVQICNAAFCNFHQILFAGILHRSLMLKLTNLSRLALLSVFSRGPLQLAPGKQEAFQHPTQRTRPAYWSDRYVALTMLIMDKKEIAVITVYSGFDIQTRLVGLSSFYRMLLTH